MRGHLSSVHLSFQLCLSQPAHAILQSHKMARKIERHAGEGTTDCSDEEADDYQYSKISKPQNCSPEMAYIRSEQRC